MFDFLKKKKPKIEPPSQKFDLPELDEIEGIEGRTDIDDIPPPEGPPEMSELKKTDQTLDDLEVPVPSGKTPDLEEGMPEFPKIPEIPKAEKKAPALKENMPLEIPDLKEPTKEIPSLEEPIEKPMPPIEKTVVKSKLEKPVKVKIRPPKANTIFIRSDSYYVLRQNLDHIRLSVKNSSDIKDKLTNLKNKEDSDLEVWKNALENMQRKLLFVDKLLFEKGGING